MKKLFVLVVIVMLQQTAIYCQTIYWQQQVNYTINVKLNDKSHTLDGYVKMDYFNNSPDTLNFIWIHLWPDAYKNDRTALNEQLLQNGRTDFYFSDQDKKGYINRLDFKVNEKSVQTVNHPTFQDIIKVILSQPLAPKTMVEIETPFHEKIPYNFSRGGHVGQAYQITQWYPKPAVYDKEGWHPITYLDQGEFYSEFGNYTVKITLPANYTVAATGTLQSENIEPDSGKNNFAKKTDKIIPKYKPFFPKKVVTDNSIPSSAIFKTIVYTQDSVHDFAWFADKSLLTKIDTLQLFSGRVIKVAAYFKQEEAATWKNSLKFIKRSIITRSNYLGEYPYNTVSVVEAPLSFNGGMEYPTIACVSPIDNAFDLEKIIEHEVGHNWNYGILATNERAYPWMDEGINTFYDNRYYKTGSNLTKSDMNGGGFLDKRIQNPQNKFVAENLFAIKKDQPIATGSEKFSIQNYDAIVYYKTGEWMQLLENNLGKPMFDSCMHGYYNKWKFKHPYPEDFKTIIESVSGKNVDDLFLLLYKKGKLPEAPIKKDIKLASFFNFKQTDKHHYIFVAPAIGANFYDKLMVGAVVHNYTLPAEKFQFLFAPLYATGSKQLNGLGRLSYDWYPGTQGAKIEASIFGETFSSDAFTDSNNYKKYLRFGKIVPSVKYVFSNGNPLSNLTTFIQWKTFFIREQNLLFTRDTINKKYDISYPSTNRYFNQLRFVLNNHRVLYPYNAEVLAEQSNQFIRLAFTGNYYFNYVKGGGLSVRLFAGKFLYLGEKTFIKQSETDIYHFNMSGPKGNEDYGYNNYFTGRNEHSNFSSQQIMNRDGFFKVRTDLLNDKVGKTDNWLMAANFTTDIPDAINIFKVLPFNIPLRLFADAGTYAEAWQKKAPTGKFIYDAGLQISFLKEMIQVYIPILYSAVYRDYFNSTLTGNKFLQNISFSINIQNFKLKHFIPQIAF